MSSMGESATGTSPIKDFYHGRSILITGGTGFMGKVLVEKLLRSCPDIDTLYLLMRPKKGVDVNTRLQREVMSCRVFNKVKCENPDVEKKVVAVRGDITLPGLGLSQEDRTMLTETVSVVFHSAATVKFDEELKVSVQMNVQGTQQIVRLCQEMNNLAVLVHVSTAYCNCDRKEIDEVLYPPPCNPQDITATCQWMSNDVMNGITPLVIGGRPNTYTYTKALAEHVLVQEGRGLPIAIVRPSIVTSAYREPLKGWVDNLNGPSGIIIAAGKGLMRSMLADSDKIADMIPVDIPINLMIVVGWYTATKTRSEVPDVYNCTSGDINEVTWGGMRQCVINAYNKFPLYDVLWYPGSVFCTSTFYHKFIIIMFEYIPAYMLDLVLWLKGNKPRMAKIVEKLQKAIDSLQYFSTREWTFSSKNSQRVLEDLNAQDREEFNYSLNDLDWGVYLENYWLGCREYVLKEDPSNMSKAKTRIKKKFWLDVATRVGTLMLVLKLLSSRSEVFRSLWRSLFSFLFAMVRSIFVLLRT